MSHQHSNHDETTIGHTFSPLPRSILSPSTGHHGSASGCPSPQRHHPFLPAPSGQILPWTELPDAKACQPRKDIHTGLKLEGGRIRPLGGSLTEADAGISPVTSSGSYAGENAEVAGAPVTSSGSYAGENAEPSSMYLREMELGEVSVGSPVFVFALQAAKGDRSLAWSGSMPGAEELETSGPCRPHGSYGDSRTIRRGSIIVRIAV